MLEDRLDTTNIGTKPAKASIIEDFITYFASTDIVKNQARRQAQYDAINLRSGNHVNTLLAHTHATKYADARKEVLFKLLGEEIAKDQFAKFTDDQKKTLLTRLVALTAG